MYRFQRLPCIQKRCGLPHGFVHLARFSRPYTSSTNVLVTGSNRGLGRSLVAHFLSEPHHNVIAAVREPRHETTQSLQALQRTDSSNLIVVRIDSASESDALNAVHDLQSDHGIDKLDVVVANAGILATFGDSSQVSSNEILNHVNVNALGPLRLFQATRELLESGKNPRFVTIGSRISSLGEMSRDDFPVVAYGASKALAHYLAVKIHHDNQAITSLILDPGVMQTDMGNSGARHFGLDEAPVPLEKASAFVFQQIQAANREEHSGKFLTIDDSRPTLLW